MVRAVLFDFDGTLLDTESTVLASWEAEYAHHGHVLDRADWLRSVGTDGRDWYEALAALVGATFDRADAHRRRRAHEMSLVGALQVREGVADCLDQARGHGLRLAVVSSSPASWVVGHLERLGLLPLFEVVVTREDAERAKPHPDLYLVALDRLGLSPDEALVVEDSANGVAAAVAAGLRVVAVPNAVTAAQAHEGAVAVVEPSALWEQITSAL